jgi:hypothetical protein
MMVTDVLDCERIAYLAGLAAGLGQALVDTDIAAATPGRFAAIPAGRLLPGMDVVPHSLAAAEGVSFVRIAPPSGRPTNVRAAGPAGSTGAVGSLGLLLAAARLGVTRRLADNAIAHLSARTSGGEPLIRKQLVLGAIADILVGVEALRRYLETAGPKTSSESIVDIHDRIGELDWDVTMLFGASGYLADQPVRVLYVSALVANTWVSREPCHARA